MNILNKEYQLRGKPFTVFYETERFVKEVMLDGEYDKYLEECKLGKDLIVMDLGCNIGTFSFNILDRSKKIYAVDASPNCIELLKKTIEYNKLTKIQPITEAVAGTNDKRHMGGITSTDGDVHFTNAGYDVDSITLPDLFEKYKIDYIDLLKIDIEGAEYEIFENPNILKLKDKIGAVVGETHGHILKDILVEMGFDYKQDINHFSAVKI